MNWPKTWQKKHKVERARSVTKTHLRVLSEQNEREDFPGLPATRGECAGGPRPCPLVSCRHNNYLDVTASHGIVKNFGELEPWEVPPHLSCSLDVADEGPAILERVGEVFGVTRERVRQIEAWAALKLGPLLREWVDHQPPTTICASDIGGFDDGRTSRSLGDDEESAPNVDSLHIGEPALWRLCFWRMYVKAAGLCDDAHSNAPMTEGEERAADAWAEAVFSGLGRGMSLREAMARASAVDGE